MLPKAISYTETNNIKWVPKARTNYFIQPHSSHQSHQSHTSPTSPTTWMGNCYSSYIIYLIIECIPKQIIICCRYKVFSYIYLDLAIKVLFLESDPDFLLYDKAILVQHSSTQSWWDRNLKDWLLLKVYDQQAHYELHNHTTKGQRFKMWKVEQ